MSTGCHEDRKTGRQTDRKADGQTDRQKDRNTFQLSYQNKSCSECQQDVRKIERQADRQTFKIKGCLKKQTDKKFQMDFEHDWFVL